MIATNTSSVSLNTLAGVLAHPGRLLGLHFFNPAPASRLDGVASASDIDPAMTLGYRHPTGRLRPTDLIGLNVRLGIARYLERELGPRFTPPALLVELVERGHLGRKSGRGFSDRTAQEDP